MVVVTRDVLICRKTKEQTRTKNKARNTYSRHRSSKTKTKARNTKLVSTYIHVIDHQKQKLNIYISTIKTLKNNELNSKKRIQ